MVPDSMLIEWSATTMITLLRLKDRGHHSVPVDMAYSCAVKVDERLTPHIYQHIVHTLIAAHFVLLDDARRLSLTPTGVEAAGELRNAIEADTPSA